MTRKADKRAQHLMIGSVPVVVMGTAAAILKTEGPSTPVLSPRRTSTPKALSRPGLTVNMILLSHLKTGISASEYAKHFIRTATGEQECVRRVAVDQNQPVSVEIRRFTLLTHLSIGFGGLLLPYLYPCQWREH